MSERAASLLARSRARSGRGAGKSERASEQTVGSLRGLGGESERVDGRLGRPDSPYSGEACKTALDMDPLNVAREREGERGDVSARFCVSALRICVSAFHVSVFCVSRI